MYPLIGFDLKQKIPAEIDSLFADLKPNISMKGAPKRIFQVPVTRWAIEKPKMAPLVASKFRWHALLANSFLCL